MGKQAKLKRLNRARKALDQFIDQGIETGKISETADGLNFNDPVTADIFYTILVRNPPLFREFIEENPAFLYEIKRAIEAEENLLLELPQN